jgi:hypothetical protein
VTAAQPGRQAAKNAVLLLPLCCRAETMLDKEITGRASAGRLRLIRADLLVRLRPVCTAMPNDIFLELIEAMAAVQLKYELHETDYAARSDGEPSEHGQR